MTSKFPIHKRGAAISVACVATISLLAWFLSGLARSERSNAQAASVETDSATATAHGASASASSGESLNAISASAVLTRLSGERIELESLDGEFERVLAEPGEMFVVGLRSLTFSRDEPVRIDADHGGSLDRRVGPIDATQIRANGELTFSYSVGGHRGRYTVEISQGPRRELLEFWVGPELPPGEPGPARVFSSPASRG